MAEPGFDDYIMLHHSLIVSLALAHIGAGALSPSDIASACRTTAENVPRDCARSRLLAFAESLERAEAHAERLLAQPWTPEVIRGGKDGGRTSN